MTHFSIPVTVKCRRDNYTQVKILSIAFKLLEKVQSMQMTIF